MRYFCGFPYLFFLICYYFPLAKGIICFAVVLLFPDLFQILYDRFSRTSILLLFIMMILALDNIQCIINGTHDPLPHYRLGRLFCENNESIPTEALTSYTRLTPSLHSFIHNRIKDTFICHSYYFLYPWLVGLLIFQSSLITFFSLQLYVL